jgi:multisubunit Na+/H+ antiporter MnhC subunit
MQSLYVFGKCRRLCDNYTLLQVQLVKNYSTLDFRGYNAIASMNTQSNSLTLITKDLTMKKIFATAAMLTLVTGQVFAQTAAPEVAPAPSAPARMMDRPFVGGVTVGTAIVVGIAVAAVAVAVSDSNSTTTHH